MENGKIDLWALFSEKYKKSQEGLALGRKGEEVSYKNADPEWKEKALLAVLAVSKSHYAWIVDEIWDYLDEQKIARPFEARAMAGVLSEACNRRYCKRTRELQRSAQKQCHGNLRSVYVSLIHEQTPN